MSRISLLFPFLQGSYKSCKNLLNEQFTFLIQDDSDERTETKSPWRPLRHHQRASRDVDGPVSLDVQEGQVSRTQLSTPQTQDQSLQIILHRSKESVKSVADRTEQMLNHHTASSPDTGSGAVQLDLVLGEMQREGMLPNFDVEGLLAFVQERLRNGQGGQVDYREFCRGLGHGVPESDERESKVKTIWGGFWVSSPHGQDRRMRRQVDPYGGLM